MVNYQNFLYALTSVKCLLQSTPQARFSSDLHLYCFLLSLLCRIRAGSLLLNHQVVLQRTPNRRTRAKPDLGLTSARPGLERISLPASKKSFHGAIAFSEIADGLYACLPHKLCRRFTPDATDWLQQREEGNRRNYQVGEDEL